MTNKELIETLRVSGSLKNVNDVYYIRILKSTPKDLEIYNTFKRLNTLGLRVGLNLELHILFLNSYDKRMTKEFEIDFEYYYKWIKAIKDFCITKDIDVYTSIFMSSFVKNRHDVLDALECLREITDVEQIKIDNIIYDIDTCFSGIGNKNMVLTRHDDKVGIVSDENVVSYILIKDGELNKGYTHEIKEDNYELIIRA